MARLGPIEYLIVVYENVWVAAMAAQLQGSGTRVVATGVIPAAELEAALNGTAPGGWPPVNSRGGRSRPLLHRWRTRRATPMP